MSHLLLCPHMDRSENASQAHQPTHRAEWLTGACPLVALHRLVSQKAKKAEDRTASVVYVYYLILE